MKKFFTHYYLLISEFIVLILCYLWFIEKYEKEPLIGIIASSTALFSGIALKLKNGNQDNINLKKNELIEKNKQLRDLFKKQLYKPFNPSELLIGTHRFNCSKIIIQNIDFIDSDENTQNKYGWYSYFGGEPYNITDVGVDLIIGLDCGFIDDNNKFVLDEKGKNFFKHAIVPYSKILNYDFNNSECRPYLYCKYSGELGPFIEIYFRELKEQ